MSGGGPGQAPDGRLTALEFARGEVGSTLRRLRQRHGITGRVLGEIVGMSQAKISKIETGSFLASPAEIALIAETLDAPAHLVAELTARAEALLDENAEWRELRGRLARAQEEVAQSEARAAVIKEFSPVAIPGILQTAEYARAIIRSVAIALKGSDSAELMDVPAAVHARVQRQQILYDPAKVFQLIISEAAFLFSPCPPAAMLNQIRHVRLLSTLSNVDVRVLTAGTPTMLPVATSFTLFDDDLVVVDLLTTGVQSSKDSEVESYRRVFDDFYQQSTNVLHPILEKYEEVYNDQVAAAEG